LISIGRVKSPSMYSRSSARQFGSCAIPVFDQIVPPSRRETTQHLLIKLQTAPSVSLL
jgi:hypothetical protein